MKKGQCLCGEIKFEVSGDARWVGSCHCRMCQRLSGGAFQTWVAFYAKELHLISGQQKDYRSSDKVIRSSCPTCSTHLFFRYIGNDEDIYITASALEGEDLKPQAHIWWNSKVQWLCLNDGIEVRLD